MHTEPVDHSHHFHESIATFGDRLEAARAAKGLTMQSLAEKLGVDVSTIEQWEYDADTPRSNHVQMLAGLLNVSIVWLINGEGNGSTHVEDRYEQSVTLNDALGEIGHLKATLQHALDRIAQLESRIQNAG